MINRMILSRLVQDGWIQDFLEVKIPPETMIKADFKEKLWIINMRITSSIIFYTHKNGVGIGYMTLSPEDFKSRYEKELIGFGKFLIFTIPVYRLRRKEPQSKLLFPVECDTITITNRDKEEHTTVRVYMIHSPSLSVKDFNIEFKKLKEASE